MYLIPAFMRPVMGYVSRLAVVALLLPGVAAAQPVDAASLGSATQIAGPGPASVQGLGVYLAYNSDYSKATLGYETPRLWGHQFHNGWGRVDLNLELGVSYWQARHGRSNSMGQVSAIPILRWWLTDGFYLEVGSGPTMLSRSEFAGRDLSTRFQLGSHLGTGFLINKAHRIGIRYSHYSNANIKKPNPGLDLLGLTYTYQF